MELNKMIRIRNSTQAWPWWLVMRGNTLIQRKEAEALTRMYVMLDRYYAQHQDQLQQIEEES